MDLVVTDLDRTLWGQDECIHDATLGALRTLEERGVPILVATGRRRRSAVEGLARSGLRLPAVVLDGAMGRDRDGRAFFDMTFTVEEATAVLEGFRAAGLEPCLYLDRPDVEVMVGPRPSTHPLHIEHIGEWLGRGDLDEAVAREAVYAFAVISAESEQLEAAARAIDGSGTSVLTRNVFFPGSSITVRPPRVSKWEGVVAYCEDQGLDPDRVLAVGDGENDLELLRGAAIACVVEDGCDAALALADHVIGCAGDGGWARILDHLT